MLYIFNGGSPVPLGYITLDGVEGVKKVTLFRHIIILCAWTAPGGRNTHYTCFVLFGMKGRRFAASLDSLTSFRMACVIRNFELKKLKNKII